MLFHFLKMQVMKVQRDPWGLLVFAAIVVACGCVYASFLQTPSLLFSSFGHDRNAHFLSALKLATDIRSLSLIQFLIDLEKIRTWPPLHALYVGGVSSFVGTDYRYSVIANIIAWGAGAFFAYGLSAAIARDCKRFAGAVTVVFYLLSPAHRAYACDFMLETLGSTLTLAALYYFIQFKDKLTNSLQPLAVSLSCLFFAKYNYWMLVVMAIVLVEVVSRRSMIWDNIVRFPWLATSNWLRAQPRVWANYPLLILIGYLVFKVGLERFHWIAPSAAQSKHENLVHFVYIALLVRVASQWKVESYLIYLGLPGPLRTLCQWHVLPILIWFVFPKRLGYFLWYLGPSNGPNAADRSLYASAMYYWSEAAEAYHSLPLLFYVAIGLAAIALVSQFLKPNAAAVVFALLFIAMALTLNHPNQKSRFLHSWLPTLWILAGLGASEIVRLVGLAFSTSMRERLSSFVTASSLMLVLPWTIWQLDHGHSPESWNRNAVSCMPVARAYLGWIPTDQKIAILGTLPVEYFAEWTYIGEFPDRARPYTAADMRWFSNAYSLNRERFDGWILEYRPQSIVLIDVLEESSLAFPDFEHFRQYRDLIAEHPEYALSQKETLPREGCEVSLWTRSGASARPAVQTNSVRDDMP